MFNNIMNIDYITYANDPYVAEDGCQSGTREGHIMAEILGRSRYIANEIRGSETESERVSLWRLLGR